MIFASLILERENVRWQDLGYYGAAWVVNVGGYAAFALVLWLIARFVSPPPKSARAPISPLQKNLFLLALLGTIIGYSMVLMLYLPALLNYLQAQNEGVASKAIQPPNGRLLDIGWMIGGLSALVAVSLSFFFDLFSWRARRIWAITRLSFKEALRQRVLWIFIFLGLLILFASWFIDVKAEDEVRSYVQVIYGLITPLILLTASLMAAFSIPTDLKNQTIHTIVTKPVEKFEIVLGRFMGYSGLMSLLLFAMTAISLLYLTREISPEARQETMRARIPLFGRLGFIGKDQDFRGISVGREWDYRSYIGGTPAAFERSQRVIYTYDDLPANLATRETGWVTCEFSFDIFRTLKGEEGKGVMCTFQFTTRNWDPTRRNAVVTQRDEERRKGASPEAIDRMIAKEYGFFEVRNKEISDYHTDVIQIPVELFQNTFNASTAPTGSDKPLMQVAAKCDSGGQYVGVAPYDFYILDAEKGFAQNFIKGAIGIWLRLELVIGLAVVCSTYLNGIISWIVTMAIFLFGYMLEYVQRLAAGQNEGGGPLESFYRLVGKEPLVTELEKTPTVSLAQAFDVGYRWILGRFLGLIPDVERFDFTNYVADGFNIAFADNILIAVVLLIGYLFPVALVGYYLIKWREVAA